MSWFVECPFCHKSVFRWFYSWHESKHTARQPDGQMNEHVTLAPENRYEGSLDEIPQTYRHEACGVATGMPEDIIRSYLVNPLTYNDSSFCCGCGDYIISSQLIWTETGETVMSYMGALRCDYVQKKYGVDPRDADVFVTPTAVKAIKRLARQHGVSPPVRLHLAMEEFEANVHYHVSLATGFNPDIEECIEGASLDVIVPQEQRLRLRGTIVHYQESPQQGFIVARLFPWDDRGSGRYRRRR